MVLDDLKQLKIFQTAGVMNDIQTDPTDKTHLYVVDKMQRFYSGDYGNISKKDTIKNNKVLNNGYGRIVATYERGQGLTDHIYIIAIINAATGSEDIENNHILIMLCREN